MNGIDSLLLNPQSNMNLVWFLKICTNLPQKTILHVFLNSVCACTPLVNNNIVNDGMNHPLYMQTQSAKITFITIRSGL